MIYLVIGPDTYKCQQALQKVIAGSNVQPEKIDGMDLDEAGLADCIAGATLFSSQRLIVIRDLSQNKIIWDKLAEWLQRVSDDTTLVLVESSADKRTKAYKSIVKAATVIPVDYWSDRDAGEAQRWVTARAKELGFALNNAQAQKIITRAMAAGDRPGSYTIDQQLLENSLQSLCVLDTITDDAIAAVLPESSADNVFELMEVALSGNHARTKQLLHNLQVAADPYMTLGFIISQWAQLVAVKITNEPPDVLAAKIGASPYVLKKMQPYAAKLALARVQELTGLLADLDMKTKTTGVDPWTAVDRFVGELGK